MINADKQDRRIKKLTLEKSRTKQTVGEGYSESIRTDGLKILTTPTFDNATWVPDNINEILR